MTSRRFPPPWQVEQIPGGFKVPDANDKALAYLETVLRDEGQRATQDRETAQRTWGALNTIKAISCLESGRSPEDADGRTCRQLAKALTPYKAGHTAYLFEKHVDDSEHLINPQDRQFAKYACWLLVAAYTAHAMSEDRKVADRAGRLMHLVDIVEACIGACSDGVKVSEVLRHIGK